MSYTKTVWVNRNDTTPERYLIDGQPADIEKDITGITEAGTSINAANMNKIETAIEEAHDTLSILEADLLSMEDTADTLTTNVTDLEADYGPLVTRAADIEQDITNLSTEVDTLESNLVSAEGDLVSLENSIDTLVNQSITDVKALNDYQSLEINKLRMELVLAQLNSIGYYDLFDTDQGINNSLTTATVDTTSQEVTFSNQVLIMEQQKFDISVNNGLVKLYNTKLNYATVLEDISNNNTLRVNKALEVGDDLFINGELVECLSVSEVENTWEEINQAANGQWAYPVVYNDTIYVKSEDDYSVWSYDILNDTWDYSGATPSGDWADPVIYNGKIYVRVTAGTDMWVYDIATNTWDETTFTFAARWYNPVLHQGKIYSRSSTDYVRIYDIDSDSLSYGSSPGDSWTYPSIYNDKMYCRNAYGTDIWVYDITSDTWDTSGSAPSGSWEYAVQYGGKIYTKGPYPYNVWIYDIESDTWDESGSAPSSLWRYPVIYNEDMYARLAPTNQPIKYEIIEGYIINTSKNVTLSSSDELLIHDYNVFVNNVLTSLVRVEGNNLTYTSTDILSDTITLKIEGSNNVVLDDLLVSVS